MEAWWNRYPEILAAEKAGLDALGYPWTINQAAYEKGRLVITVQVPSDTGPALPLVAEYPATYPYFPPFVAADDVVFSRHQHPVGKNLCLLAREGEQWEPVKDSLAVLLRDQLPLIQAINAGTARPDAAAEQEDHVGEPLSSFLAYNQNSVLIVPDDEPDIAHSAGRLSIKYRPVPPKDKPSGFLSGVVTSVQDINGNPLCTLDAAPPPSFALVQKGYWMRLPTRPDFSGIDALRLELFHKMQAALPAFAKAIRNGRRGESIVIGFLYKDETTWRKQSHDWLILHVRIEREAKRSQDAKCMLFSIRADWGGEQAWMQRAPGLLPLRKKTAVLFGLGSLGSPVALHLARAGVKKLTLLDSDHLQVGNTIRWALGWQYAGVDKAIALCNHITHEYPYTNVQGYKLHLGGINPEVADGQSDYDLIKKLIDDADAIVDASANHRVSNFLADLARELGKPYIWLTTTHGCAGGIVGRQLPLQTHGCWHCFLHQMKDGSIRLPAEATTEDIQPGGCSQATFVGAGIDSEEIALLGARLTVATLCRGEDGYPDFEWNVAVGDVQQNGISVAPTWSPYPLPPHRACLNCAPR